MRSSKGVFGFAKLFVVALQLFFAYALVFAVSGASPVSAEAAKPLDIPKKNRALAVKDNVLIIVLDLKPSSDDLRGAAAAAPDLISSTAASYAKQYLESPDYATVQKAIVYLISVENMDEYNRANFDGMKRFGTITYERQNSSIVQVENSLTYSP